jgi:trimeric autotransporter adhesin
MISNSQFSKLLALITLIGTVTMAVAQQPDVVQQWLASTCPVGEANTVPASFTGSVPEVVSELITALQSGPSPTLLSQVETGVSASYNSMQSALISGKNAGLDQSDISALQAESSQAYIANNLAAFVLSYRARAIQGLAVARSATGLAAIQSVLISSTDPALLAVAKQSLMGVADVNGDGLVNCVDLSIVKASFGKSAGQSGFNSAADVNKDGVVNIFDLSFVARQLPAGTVCK